MGKPVFTTVKEGLLVKGGLFQVLDLLSLFVNDASCLALPDFDVLVPKVVIVAEQDLEVANNDRVCPTESAQ